MKRLIVSLCSALCISYGYTQNVGVNTTTPQASLDVRGSQRVGGLTSYTMFDSLTGNIQWNGAALYAPVYQPIIRHSTSTTEGLYAGTGRLEYRDATGAVFFTDYTTGNGYFKNRLGINTNNPQYPLSFSNTLGEKISFNNAAVGYGIELQSSVLRIHTDVPSSDVAFGPGAGSNFQEMMRITGFGNLGIGTTSPNYRLDVNGRMRIRSGGTPSTSAGIFLNNASNVEAAFVGMQDDTHVGFFGQTSGWRFAMSTTTGALRINGLEGVPGQVLQSNGAGAPASWTTPVDPYFNYTMLTDNNPLTITQAMGRTVIPGLTYTFTVTNFAKLVVSYSVPIATVGCASCPPSAIILDLLLNGTPNGSIRSDILNGQFLTMSSSRTYTLDAGSYTLALAATVTGPNAILGPCCVFDKVMNIQVIQAQ